MGDPKTKTGNENRAEVKSLADEEIVTERKLPRWSFLAVGGAVLAAGAWAVVSPRLNAALDDPGVLL